MRECAALARTKLEFVRKLLDLCRTYKCFLLACIVPKAAPRPASRDFLRKDYAYRFERFFYFLDDRRTSRGSGIIVFDELEKTRSHILIGQMDSYFKNTRTGQRRSELVIPEPFFVHSDLTTGVQIADLMAYLVAWGHFKTPGAAGPARPELAGFASVAAGLAHDTSRPQKGGTRLKVRGVTLIRDLRARSERR